RASLLGPGAHLVGGGHPTWSGVPDGHGRAGDAAALVATGVERRAARLTVDVVGDVPRRLGRPDDRTVTFWSQDPMIVPHERDFSDGLGADVGSKSPVPRLDDFADLVSSPDVDVIRENAVFGRHRLLRPRADADRHRHFAVDEGVEGDDGVYHRKITVQRRVDDAVHEADGAARVVAAQLGEVIVHDDVTGADDANSGRSAHAAAQKVVLFHPAVVAVAQRQSSRTFTKRVSAIDVLAGFVGNDLGFAVALFKEIVFDDASPHGRGSGAVAD